MQHLEPNKKNQKKFDLDLQYGKVREKKIAEMLENKKIEVKSERDIWQKTGNIAIEYECYGKPSGICSTEADYWFHNLCIGEDTFATIVFETKSLKRIIDKLDYKRTVSGGDNMASRMYLLNLQKLFSSDVIKVLSFASLIAIFSTLGRRDNNLFRSLFRLISSFLIFLFN